MTRGYALLASLLAGVAAAGAIVAALLLRRAHPPVHAHTSRDEPRRDGVMRCPYFELLAQ